MSLTGLLIALNYDKLPDKTPIFFNHPIAEKGYGGKQTLWELLFVISLIISFFFWLIKFSNTHLSSAIPLLKKPELGKRVASEILLMTALLSAISCFAIITITIYSATGEVVNGKELLYPTIPIILIAGPLLYLVISLIKNLKN